MMHTLPTHHIYVIGSDRLSKELDKVVQIHQL